MNAREIAYRILATELNGSSLKMDGEEEQSPSYTVTPLGLPVNRVFIAGTLTENTRTGTDEEPVWRAVVEDPTGRFFVQASRFQPAAAASLAGLDAENKPLVGIIGKVNTWTNNEGTTYVNIRPETVAEISKEDYGIWLFEAVSGMWKRLVDVRVATKNPDSGVEELAGMGLGDSAKYICAALDQYGNPDSTRYLRSVQAALRKLLPDRDIDFGLPGDVQESIVSEPEGSGNGPSAGDAKDIIVRLIGELDNGIKGAFTDDIIRHAEAEGISSSTVETLLDELINEGGVYEPSLGYIRVIE